MTQGLIPGDVAPDLFTPAHGVERLAFQLLANQLDRLTGFREDAQCCMQQAQIDVARLDVACLVGQALVVVLVVLGRNLVGQLVDQLGEATQVIGERSHLLAVERLAVEDRALGLVDDLGAAFGHVHQHVQADLAEVQLCGLALGQQGTRLVLLEVH